jgi:Flp pilus assembly protein TadD
VNPLPGMLRLVPFPDSIEAEQDVRDLALARQSLAASGVEAAEPHAETLLRSAASEFPKDAEILTALGYVDQKHGLLNQARELYQQALMVDPDSIDAASNLGVIEAQTGHMGKAATLWQGTFQRAPGRSGIGLNLVLAFCEVGAFDEARTYTLRILEFNPDMAAAKMLLRYLTHTPPSCRD